MFNGTASATLPRCAFTETMERVPMVGERAPGIAPSTDCQSYWFLSRLVARQPVLRNAIYTFSHDELCLFSLAAAAKTTRGTEPYTTITNTEQISFLSFFFFSIRMFIRTPITSLQLNLIAGPHAFVSSSRLHTVFTNDASGLNIIAVEHVHCTPWFLCGLQAICSHATK